MSQISSSRALETADPPATSSPIPGAAVAAIGGAIALAVTNAVVGFTPGYGDIDSTADMVRVVGESPVLTEIGVVTMLIAAALIVPGVWAVAAALRPRTPRLAAIGGWAMATGYVMGMVLATDTLTALAVAGGGNAASYGDAIDNHMPAVSIALYAVFGLGALAGGLILGIAMLRQRGTVPAWAGWALIASEPVRVAGLLTGVALGPVLASVLIAVAFGGVLLARRAQP